MIREVVQKLLQALYSKPHEDAVRHAEKADKKTREVIHKLKNIEQKTDALHRLLRDMKGITRGPVSAREDEGCE
jgi:uncharacterized protein Yka (UPF0111/DUF47 family)